MIDTSSEDTSGGPPAMRFNEGTWSKYVMGRPPLKDPAFDDFEGTLQAAQALCPHHLALGHSPDHWEPQDE